MFGKWLLSSTMVLVLLPIGADAQSVTNMAVLKGLAPVSVLANSNTGKAAALAANYTITDGVQLGVIRQPTLLPFAEQQQQALRDAFITKGNLAERACCTDTIRYISMAYDTKAGDRSPKIRD